MHETLEMSDACPQCGEAHESVFKRQGCTRDGLLLVWYEFRCLPCRRVWIVVGKLGIVERMHG